MWRHPLAGPDDRYPGHDQPPPPPAMAAAAQPDPDEPVRGDEAYHCDIARDDLIQEAIHDDPTRRAGGEDDDVLSTRATRGAPLIGTFDESSPRVFDTLRQPKLRVIHEAVPPDEIYDNTLGKGGEEMIKAAHKARLEHLTKLAETCECDFPDGKI